MKFSKAIKNDFLAKLPRRIPAFRQSAAALSRPSNTLFESTVANDLYFFIYCFVTPKRDDFTIEIAWNLVRQFPFEMMPGSVMSAEGNFLSNVLGERKYRARISSFLGLRRDMWWGLEPRKSAVAMLNDLENLMSQPIHARVGERREPCEGTEISVTKLVDEACEALVVNVIPFLTALAIGRQKKAEWEKLMSSTP